MIVIMWSQLQLMIIIMWSQLQIMIIIMWSWPDIFGSLTGPDIFALNPGAGYLAPS